MFSYWLISNDICAVIESRKAGKLVAFLLIFTTFGWYKWRIFNCIEHFCISFSLFMWTKLVKAPFQPFQQDAPQCCVCCITSSAAYIFFFNRFLKANLSSVSVSFVAVKKPRILYTMFPLLTSVHRRGLRLAMRWRWPSVSRYMTVYMFRPMDLATNAYEEEKVEVEGIPCQRPSTIPIPYKVSPSQMVSRWFRKIVNYTFYYSWLAGLVSTHQNQNSHCAAALK